MATPSALSEPTIYPVLVDVTRRSIHDVLTALTGSEPTPVPDCDRGTPCDGIWGSVSFVGDLLWSIMLGFPRDTATALTLRFTGFEIDFDSPDMGDAIGELVNILAGDIVAHLESHGIEAAMSLPTVVRGHDIEVILPHEVGRMRAAYEMAEGRFWVELAADHMKAARTTHGVCPVCGR
jgi:CheY-specific phosphatase CheX